MSRVVVSAAEGYKFSVRIYDGNRTFIENPFSGWKPEYTIYPKGNLLYRFVIARTDDAAYSADDLPANALTYVGYVTEDIYSLEYRYNLMNQTLNPATTPVEARPKIGTDGYLWKQNGTPYAVDHGMGIMLTQKNCRLCGLPPEARTTHEQGWKPKRTTSSPATSGGDCLTHPLRQPRDT